MGGCIESKEKNLKTAHLVRLRSGGEREATTPDSDLDGPQATRGAIVKCKNMSYIHITRELRRTRQFYHVMNEGLSETRRGPPSRGVTELLCI
jgi:hypothetical protein